MSLPVFGFSPNRYHDVQNAGREIYISPGEIGRTLIPGKVVVAPASATTNISMDQNGNIYLYFGAGFYPIATVVAGQVVTSGNTGKNATTSNGIISITDVRPTSFAF